MDTETIQKAWDECELEETDIANASLIGPAVFEPQMDTEFVFEESLQHGDLWEDIKSMDKVSFMTEPFDGFLRASAYVWINDGGRISFRSYPNRIKIAPADEETTYDEFEHFINEFEKNVCELKFLGGLENMNTD